MKTASKSVVIIVAHPDDETLWAGGTILSHPSWRCFVVCLCRGNDPDRAPRFYEALKVLKSEGTMGDMDDGPDQSPMHEKETEEVILNLIPHKHFDLIITHSPHGEYTRHIRHEETGRAVIKLWQAGKISAGELWAFAYEDGGRQYYPRPVEHDAFSRILTRRIWMRKHSIITQIYGFEKGSFEEETTPRAESFWQFSDSYAAKKWLNLQIFTPANL